MNENFYSPLLSFFEFAGYLATALAVGGTIIGLAMLGGGIWMMLSFLVGGVFFGGGGGDIDDGGLDGGGGSD